MTSSSPDLTLRRAGVLLHPTSLPSGMIDDDVERWLDTLASTGISIWQVLPLGEPESGLSPYQCTSAFAMNPELAPESTHEVAYVDSEDTPFTDFCLQNRFWLDDYCLFKVLKQHFDDSSWYLWPEDFKLRHPVSLQHAEEQFSEQLLALKWQQFHLYLRWQQIRDAATERNILLFGDMPIFVGYDSTDVWARRDLFMLDDDGRMEVVTGVPPDYFSDTGQRWGNPHYDWDAMQADGFSWWQARIKHHLEQFDLLRIDHFRGLESAWVIDAACDTAIDGHWQKTPGDALLNSFTSEFEHLPFIAEDLGVITEEVTALRKKFELPGMSILQFGFDEFDDNPHKPHNIEADTVVYTGTHDNDTSKGWFDSLEEHVKKYVLVTLGIQQPEQKDWHLSAEASRQVVEQLIDNAMRSQADICMVPLQDILQLGSEARMNTPGTTTGNWQWQFQWQQLENNDAMDWFSHLIETTHRKVATHG